VPRDDIARRLASLSASAVADATGGEGVMSPGLVRFSGSGTVAGRAVTAECAEGSLRAIHSALDQTQPGDVLCATAPGATAYLGDLLAADMVNRGIAAAVIDGLIRDKDAIAGLPASFFARGVTPAVRRGDEPGRPMVPVRVGGVEVSPGDWVVADGDGVVVIPPQQVQAALQKAEDDAKVEARIMARIKAGAKIMDAVGQELGASPEVPAGDR
jgi:4-hydroxy-4-methyl-2-oxoglutarate aldolase